MKKIITYKNYFAEFMDKLSELERKKIQRALSLLRQKTRYRAITLNSFVMEYMNFVWPVGTMNYASFLSTTVRT